MIVFKFAVFLLAICIKYAYYGTIRAESGLSPSVAPTTPTVAPVTRSFSSPDFPKDPYLITHDILVVINQRTNGGSSALRGVNAIAINFVGQLSTTTNANSDSGTRLSLASLTPYDPYYALRGDIWGLNASTLTTALPYNGIAIEGNIDQALTGLVDLAFTVNQNTTADSRRNVQRSIILFTGEWPTNAQLSLDVKNKFDSKGVNLLIVGYNLTDTEQSQLLRTDNRWYNAVNTQQTKSPAVASFVNPFYFNDGSATNYWCPPHPVTPSVDTTYVWFQEPYNYAGPYGTQDWNGFSSYDGQSNRYCNFANSVYTYNMPSTANTMKVQVFFELEAGKDFLNFYDASNNLIASFTGYDISASTFYTSTTTLTARFISDNQSIYRGFYVSITPQTL
uniref:VWFA domain-containing protein n=1 Tax=Caenorhabditis tropicalis TaxID=1561998 RepID=A0A1I7TLJ1_9PELO